ncbi:MAG: beta-glucosidase [Bryobacterales bacterium]|nr:beta-glucosidase [Bryobacterales bacterium]MBV9399653.1 beta-glucosidase [Bryobacterales bacterium]
MRLRFIAIATIVAGATALAQDDPVPRFGTTVVVPFGLRGLIYNVRKNTTHLPDNLHKRKPTGKPIYTESLNVPPQMFEKGFPGVTARFEWFAIDYTGRFWIAKPGTYRFALTSDDGANLYIDGDLIIDNDGIHPPRTRESRVDLKRGIHTLRVPYFQGPRFMVALVLEVAGEGEDLRVFSTNEFKPPPNPATWMSPGNPSNVGDPLTGQTDARPQN